jgi:hypothetical protein
MKTRNLFTNPVPLTGFIVIRQFKGERRCQLFSFIIRLSTKKRLRAARNGRPKTPIYLKVEEELIPVFIYLSSRGSIRSLNLFCLASLMASRCSGVKMPSIISLVFMPSIKTALRFADIWERISLIFL